jgi:hypothetical protein
MNVILSPSAVMLSAAKHLVRAQGRLRKESEQTLHVVHNDRLGLNQAQRVQVIV